MKKTKIIVVGSGFAGNACANELSKIESNAVTLVDDNNKFTFFPTMLKQINGHIDHDQINFTPKDFLSEKVNFVNCRLMDIDKTHKKIITNGQALKYDQLIIATGGASFMPDTIDVADNAIVSRARSFSDIKALKGYLLSLNATHSCHITIMGAGLTGCELAAELCQFSRQEDHANLQITLLEADELPLPGFEDSIRNQVADDLEEMGCILRLHTKVTAINKNSVTYEDGNEFSHDLLFNALGVKGSAPTELVAKTLNSAPNQPIATNKFAQVKGHKCIWAIGDCADNIDKNGHKLPMTAQVAEALGKSVSENIMKQLQGKPLSTVSYFSKGTFIPLGGSHYYIVTPLMNFSGVVAKQLWWLFYGFKLPTNKAKWEMLKASIAA